MKIDLNLFFDQKRRQNATNCQGSPGLRPLHQEVHIHTHVLSMLLRFVVKLFQATHVLLPILDCWVWFRAVESESLKVEKNRIKSEKSDLIFY